MKDGIYIKGVWICDADCALTFQGNDLTKPDQRTASYSNTFTLPDSLTVRDLLEGAEQLDAGGPNPYKQLPAKLIEEGEVIFSGIIEFGDFKGGWSVNLYDSMVSFFDAIKDKSIRSLDLSRLDHPWTLEHITSVAGSSAGVVYPLVDYGGIDEGIVPYDTACPAVYVKDIFGQICKEAGYKPTGEWLYDPMVEKLALPFVGAEPVAHSEDWVKDRSARVTTKGGNHIQLRNGSPINVVLPLTNDANTLDGWEQGRLKPYNTSRSVYICSQNMRLKVYAQVLFTSITQFGSAEVKLILERNGQEVDSDFWEKAGYYDHLDIPDMLKVETSVDCLAGDELRLHLTGSSGTDFSSYTYLFSQQPGDMWASFVPDAAVHLGDMWPVAQNLPDLSCKDLVISLAKALCGTFVIDDFRKTVRLSTFDEVIKNLPESRDWSESVDESQEPELALQLEGYGKDNLMKWKEATEKADVGYGDGILSSPTLNTPKQETLFELPFMACVESENSIGGYGNPILIKTRQVSGTGDKRTVNPVDAAPRLILIEPTKTGVVQTRIWSVDNTVTEVPVTLTACWWAKRPAGARTDDNAFSLAFSPVSGQVETGLIDRYFKGLKRVLRRPRQLTISMYLQPSDVSGLDLSIPIRLQKVRAGALDINDNYFYLNQVKSYRSGRTCTAVLIAV